MPSAFVPTVPIVPGSDYFEEASRRFQSRIDEPVATFKRQLQQGTTGPAPALTVDDDGNVQIESPEGFDRVNRGLVDVLGGDPGRFDRFSEEAAETGTSPGEFIGAVLVLVAVLGAFLIVLNAFVGGFAEGLAQR